MLQIIDEFPNASRNNHTEAFFCNIIHQNIWKTMAGVKPRHCLLSSPLHVHFQSVNHLSPSPGPAGVQDQDREHDQATHDERQSHLVG